MCNCNCCKRGPQGIQGLPGQSGTCQSTTSVISLKDTIDVNEENIYEPAIDECFIVAVTNSFNGDIIIDLVNVIEGKIVTVKNAHNSTGLLIVVSPFQLDGGLSTVSLAANEAAQLIFANGTWRVINIFQ